MEGLPQNQHVDLPYIFWCHTGYKWQQSTINVKKYMFAVTVRQAKILGLSICYVHPKSEEIIQSEPIRTQNKC